MFLKEFVYPSRCLSCGERGEVICRACRAHLEILRGEGRCPRCFVKKVEVDQECCPCDYPYSRYGAVFEKRGPAQALLVEMQKNDAPGLVRMISSFLVLQLYQLGWPIPEVILSVPMRWIYRLKIGFDPHRLIGKELAKIFGCRFGGKEIEDRRVMVVAGWDQNEMIDYGKRMRELYPRSLYGLVFSVQNSRDGFSSAGEEQTTVT